MLADAKFAMSATRVVIEKARLKVVERCDKEETGQSENHFCQSTILRATFVIFREIIETTRYASHEAPASLQT